MREFSCNLLYCSSPDYRDEQDPAVDMHAGVAALVNSDTSMPPDSNDGVSISGKMSEAPGKFGEGLSTADIVLRRPRTSASRAGSAAVPPGASGFDNKDIYFTTIYSETYNNTKLRDMMYASRTVPRPSELYGARAGSADDHLAHLAGKGENGASIPPKPGKGRKKVAGNLAYLDKTLTTIGTPLDSIEPIVTHKVGVFVPPAREPAVYASSAFAASRITGGKAVPQPYGPKTGTVAGPWDKATLQPWERPQRIRTNTQHLAKAETGLSATVSLRGGRHPASADSEPLVMCHVSHTSRRLSTRRSLAVVIPIIV